MAGLRKSTRDLRLVMTDTKYKKQPLITYQFTSEHSENENNDKLNRAFDILFEEVEKQISDLTILDG